MTLPTYHRPHVSELLRRLGAARPFIIAVTGPRQVGKTTLVRQALDVLGVPYHYDSADGVARNANVWIAKQWEVARAAAQGGTAVLVLDEIQKVPSWSEEVKRYWDEDRRNGVDVKVIVLGSSSILVSKGLGESLAGRFERLRIMPWSYTEMREAFGWDVDTYVTFGGYPGPAGSIADRDWWMEYMRDSIIEPVILRDVLMMHSVEKPHALRMLLELGATMSGREVSFTKLMHRLDDLRNAVTVAHYLDLLEEAGMLCGLSKFSATEIRRRRSSPKLQVFANAMFTVMTANSREAGDERFHGRAVESAVGAHLRCLVEGTAAGLTWWRENNNEVDYVVQHGASITAIEVKSGLRPSRQHGLSAFRAANPTARIMEVGPNGLPLDTFLSMPLNAIVGTNRGVE